MSKTKISPPGHLSDRSKALWAELVPRRARSPERLELLTVALEARDRAAEARAAVDAEGLTTTTETTKAVHIHPLLRVEKDSWATFVRVWKELDLERAKSLDGQSWDS
jgi:phage terminase small subunit